MAPPAETAEPAASAEDRSDVEKFADALLATVEDRLGIGGESSPPDLLAAAMHTIQDLGTDFVRRYHRLDVQTQVGVLDNPVLFVANHGFGTIFDLNVFALGAAIEQLQLTRPVTVLTHQLAWTFGVGALIEPLGARPASHESAHEAFEKGHHVLVLPGGDLDAFKSWSDRNNVIFGGRAGFARLAMGQDVPIVPIVTAGAGDSLLVLSNGERLARALKLDKVLRLKALPVSVSLPWGVSIGGVGFLPYLPLPTKLQTRILPAMTARPGESAEDYATRVQEVMQINLDDLAGERRPFIG